MLTLYAQYRNDELRELQAHCFRFCAYQHYKEAPYSNICANCEKHRVCKDLTSLAYHCEALINSRKSEHC